MNAAVSKLRKDFWKNEHPEEEETEKEIETVNNKDTDNELQQKDGQVDAEKTTEVQVAQTETVQFKSKQLKKRQTDVSKIRRSIFKLPVSSPYTQYYPPEDGDVQAESPLSDQGGTTKGSSLSSAARDKTKGKIEQNDQSNPADKSKPDDRPDAIAKNPRCKALARRQSSNNELTTESEQNTKENKDRQSSDQQKDKLTAGPQGYGEKRELRRMKGHFFCDKCQKRWMSLHVYCEPGTKKVRLYL